MYTFSGELPFKESVRLAGVLTVSDLEKLRAQLLLHETRDMVLSWLKDGCQFHLVGKHKMGTITWQLFHSKGLNTSLTLQTGETNLQAVYALLVLKTNDVVRAERSRKGGRIDPSLATTTELEISSAFQTKVSDAEWINALFQNGQSEPIDEARCHLIARAFLRESQQYASSLAALYNDRAADENATITITDAGSVEEMIGESQKVKFTRWRASTLYWSLSARVHSNKFELFIMRSAEAMGLSSAEQPGNRLCELYCTTSPSGVKWWNGKLPVSAEEMRGAIRNGLSKLIDNSLDDLNARDGKTAAPRLTNDEIEKRNLAQKIIAQQEQLQRQIARDLHDAVIADVTVLKRALKGESGNVEISKERIIESLDGIATRLREICYDLSPSDLRDWGLQTTLEALIEQASERTSAKCMFKCELEIPQFEGSIDLHIFRVLQESVTNIIKYAQATELVLRVKRDKDDIVFTVTDNGKGIDFTAAIKQAKGGGMGMNTMQERVGLIRVYYPATLTVRSVPGKGTVTRLAIQAPR